MALTLTYNIISRHIVSKNPIKKNTLLLFTFSNCMIVSDLEAV